MTPLQTTRPWSQAVPETHAGLRVVYGTERILAAIAILLLAPFGFMIAIVLAMLSGRGPLVSHTRAGWHGQPLRMLKFRTMWPGSPPKRSRWSIEDVTGPVPVFKLAPDVRVISRFAAFCRRYSLDELPQLYHVVRGEMSLVGPRPITTAELAEFYGDCTEEVLAMRPGLSGLWQISGRNQLSYAERKRLDLILVREASVGLYCSILLRSVCQVLSGNGSR